MRTPLCPLLLLALATLPAPAAGPPSPGDPLPEGAAARLGSARFRLDFPGYNCSPSPDGSLFAVPQHDGIRLLGTRTGKEVRRLETGPAGMAFARFTPDGKHLLSWDYAGNVSLWDVRSGRQVRRVAFAPARRRFGSFSPSADGKVLVACPDVHGEKATIVAYDGATGKQLASLESAHNYSVRAAVSPDGRAVASWGSLMFRGGGDDGAERERLMQTVQLWNVRTGKLVRKLSTGRGAVMNAAFSPDGKTLALATQTWAIQFWDPATGKCRRTFQGAWGVGAWGVGAALTFSPDGRLLVAAGSWWRPATWARSRPGTCGRASGCACRRGRAASSAGSPSPPAAGSWASGSISGPSSSGTCCRARCARPTGGTARAFPR
jgi:WD40 repeat protein